MHDAHVFLDRMRSRRRRCRVAINTLCTFKCCAVAAVAIELNPIEYEAQAAMHATKYNRQRACVAGYTKVRCLFGYFVVAAACRMMFCSIRGTTYTSYR